jgi:uncharacterized OB-fold protein
MAEYMKPVPIPDHVTGRFWEAAKRHCLLIQRCRDCGSYQFFPQSYCRKCLSENIDWVETSGKGEVYSYTIVYRPPSLMFEDDVPYTVALVDLSEGVRLMSNIIGIEPEEVCVGMAVEVVFDDISPLISLPKFRPVEAS